MENTGKFLLHADSIRTFGRIHGKRLSARQQWLVDNLLPQLSPVVSFRDGQSANPESGKDQRAEKVSNREAFLPTVPFQIPDNSAARNFRNDTAILEIGFGAGEHILHIAKTFPSQQIIGAEPFINGVASLLSAMTEIRDQRPEIREFHIKPEYQNICIWPDDVRKLLSIISDNQSLKNINFAFSKIYVLHPDPWPKARHEKRRLLSAEFLNELTGHLAPGGQIIIGTDHTDYFNWVLEQVAKTNLKMINSDFTDPPESGLDTRYQKKNKFGSDRPMYLVLARK